MLVLEKLIGILVPTTRERGDDPKYGVKIRHSVVRTPTEGNLARPRRRVDGWDFKRSTGVHGHASEHCKPGA